MKKIGENPQTGEQVEYELVNGQWKAVRTIREAQKPAAAAPARPMGYGQMMATMIPAGATMGFSDELRGLMEGAIAGAVPGGESASETYQRAVQSQRENIAQSREQYPNASLAAEFAGGFAAPIPGAGWIRNAASAPAMAGRLAAVGAGTGAVAGLGEATSMNEAPAKMLQGAGIGAAAGPAFGAAANALGGIGRRGYEMFAQSPLERAQQNIRTRAQGISPAEIQAGLAARGPASMLLDVDPSFTRIARGTALTDPNAERIATQALNQRQATAPQRMAGYIENAAQIPPSQQIGAMRADVEAAKQQLGPQYRALENMAVDITPDLQKVLSTPRMAAALRKAISNWQTKNPGAPDPTKVGGVLPADVVQEMKRVVDETINSPTADPADVAAARSIKQALLQYVDPEIPGYQQLREEYGRRVMQPTEGMEIGGGLYSGREDALAETMAGASRLSPEGKAGYRAGALQDALNAVNYRAGTGDQFYGADIMGGNMLALERAMQLTGGDRARAMEMLRRFGVEREFLANRSSVLPSMGSQTAARAQSAGEVSPSAASVLTDAKTGGAASVLQSALRGLIGDSPAVAEETMRILTKSGMTRAEIEQIMSGYVPPTAYEALQRAAPLLQRLSQGSSAAGVSQGALQPQQ
jgi:hypothetical protein